MNGISPEPIEVSVVMPCLNEEDTLQVCLEKTRRAFDSAGIRGEIIVADNGSVDRSVEIAESFGARVVHVKQRGYGAALASGIEAAQGKFVVMGDADDSYDFLELPSFVEKLREGFDLVQGCRLPAGGGRVVAGAMPWSHRWIGNPMFTWLVRNWFGAPVNDVYCGLRGFKKSLIADLDLRSSGMEFATEMIIKANLHGKRIAEVPITLHPDGRKSHAPHLKTFRDGWRTLRFFLLCSPRWLFIIPGWVLLAMGFLGYGIALPGFTIGSLTFDAHTLLFASLFLICGSQSLSFAAATKTFAVSEGLLPDDAWRQRFARMFSLEKGLIVMVLLLAVGGLLLLMAINEWRVAEFGRLDYAETMRVVIPGATAIAVGVQVGFSSFFISLLGMRRADERLERGDE